MIVIRDGIIIIIMMASRIACAAEQRAGHSVASSDAYDPTTLAAMAVDHRM